MTSLDPVLRALASAAGERVEVSTPSANAVHCHVSSQDVAGVVDVALRELGTELILMAADDRRRQSNAFFIHYLFARRADNWFLHLSVRLDGSQPELVSLAPSCYPASRFEREIRDLFGIAISGHPDPTPLVKHGFWPSDYYPLRKDAPTADFSQLGPPLGGCCGGGACHNH